MRLPFLFFLTVSTATITAQMQSLKQLWGDSTTDASGGVSGGGQILPHVDWTICDLAVKDLQSGTSRRLGVNSACADGYPLRPTLSPDGSEIAYAKSLGSSSAIFVIDVAGGQPQLVVEDPEFDLRVQAWRVTDGKELIVTKATDARDAEIGILTIPTKAYRRLVVSARGAQNMSVSADGRLLAYEQWQTSNPALREVKVVTIQTGKEVPLPLNGDTYSPVWSPAGDRLLFLKTSETSRDLYEIVVAGRASGAAPTRVRDLPMEATLLGFDGAKNLLIRDDSPSRVTRLGRIQWPAGEVQLTSPLDVPPLTESRRASFSHSGDRIAFQLKTGSEIVRPGWATPAVKVLNDGRTRTYPTQLTIRDEAVWLPDASALLVVHDEAGQGEGAGPAWSFWRLDLAGGKYERLGVAAGQGLVRLGGVRGNTLIYKRTDYGAAPKSFIEVFDLSSRTASTLHTVEGAVAEIAASSDGKRVAYTVRGTGGTAIHLLDMTSRQSTLVNTPRYRASAREQFTWMPNDDSLLMEGRFGDQQGIWRVPLNGDPPTRLPFDAKSVVEARVSPDAKQIAVTIRSDPQVRLWALKMN